MIVSMSVVQASIVGAAVLLVGAQRQPLDGAQVFARVCLDSAPSFERAKAAATRFGVKSYMSLGDENIGTSVDGSISVQIKPGKECVVGTPQLAGENSRKSFLKVVAAASKTDSITKLRKMPFTATVRGATFVFQHERDGGDMFIMLSSQ